MKSGNQFIKEIPGKVIGVRFGLALYRQIKVAAARDDRTVSSFIRKIVQEYFNANGNANASKSS